VDEFFELLLILYLSLLASLHDARRGSNHDCIRWYVLSNQALRTDDRTCPYLNPIHNHRSSADPGVVANPNSSAQVHALLNEWLAIGAMLMIAGTDISVRCNQHTLAENNP
jgi:hypothetical protein